jgi:hypothetical protein
MRAARSEVTLHDQRPMHGMSSWSYTSMPGHRNSQEISHTEAHQIVTESADVLGLSVSQLDFAI